MVEGMLEKGTLNDPDQTLEAAKAGDTDAMYRLAHAYQFAEIGDAPDYETAYQWYEKAARLGHIEAMTSLGDALMLGRGCKMDRVTASGWYQEAYDIEKMHKGHANFR